MESVVSEDSADASSGGQQTANAAQDMPDTNARPVAQAEGVEENPNSAGTAVANGDVKKSTPMSPRGDLDAAVTSFEAASKVFSAPLHISWYLLLSLL